MSSVCLQASTGIHRRYYLVPPPRVYNLCHHKFWNRFKYKTWLLSCGGRGSHSSREQLVTPLKELPLLHKWAHWFGGSASWIIQFIDAHLVKITGVFSPSAARIAMRTSPEKGKLTVQWVPVFFLLYPTCCFFINGILSSSCGGKPNKMTKACLVCGGGGLGHLWAAIH